MKRKKEEKKRVSNATLFWCCSTCPFCRWLPRSLLPSVAVSRLPLLVSTAAETLRSLLGWPCLLAVAAATAAAAGAVLGPGVARAFPLVASLTDAPLPCQMRLYFCGTTWANANTLERWSSAHDKTENKEADVQECSGVKSVYDSTLPLSLGWLCAQADWDTHRCCNKIHLQTAFRSFTMRSPIPWSASASVGDMKPSCKFLWMSS